MTLDLLTLGQPIVALLPVEPVPFSEEVRCRWSVGGAELNVAVGLRRLGFTTAYAGHVGADPLGQMVTEHLRRETLPIEHLLVDPERPTACYLREWLPDGERRLVYHRAVAAGTRWHPDDLRWPDDPPRLLHITGITPALDASAATAVLEAVARARALGVAVSFDPNYRRQLWSADDARAVLAPLAASCDLLLMSDDDAELLHPGSTGEESIRQALDRGPSVVVLKRGAAGAWADDGNGIVQVDAASVARAVDPVGAGDAFDAGFLAGWLRAQPLERCLALGAHLGARAVEEPGEHDAAPRLGDLPAELQRALAPTDDERRAVTRT